MSSSGPLSVTQCYCSVAWQRKGQNWTILMGDSNCILGNVSSPFSSANNTTVTAYHLESPLAQFKKFCLLFFVLCVCQGSNKECFCVVAFLFPLLWREQKVYIQPKLSRISYNNKFVTQENFANIATDSLALNETAN